MDNQENGLTLFYSSHSNGRTQTSEEVLVADSRDGQSPAQVVERKLISILQGGQVLVSHLQSRRARCPSA